jgi:MYXO-CTERM domain-containing protein
MNAHWRGAQTLRLAGNDSNGDPLTFALGTQPTRGAMTMTNAATGDVGFTPSGAFVGADSFTYTVNDGADGAAAQSVQLNLTNTVPTAPNPTYSVVVGSTTSGRVAGTDANSDPLTYSVLSMPTRGTLTLDSSNGLFDYIPAAGTGSVTAQVAVRDGVSESAPVTVTFNYPAANSSSGGGGGGGGSLDLLILAVLGMALIARIRRRNH